MKTRMMLVALGVLTTMVFCTGCGSENGPDTAERAVGYAGGAAEDAGSAGDADGAGEADGAEDAGSGEEKADAGSELGDAVSSVAPGEMGEADDVAVGDAMIPENAPAAPGYDSEDEAAAPEKIPDLEAPDDGLDRGDDSSSTATEYLTEESIIEGETAEETPVQERVNMLTAGEWKDHENWGFFSNLVKTGTISFPSFGLDPTSRIAVTVKNAEGTILPNVKAELLDEGGEVLWSSVTDMNGNAYLFDTAHSAAQVRISSEGAEQTQAVDAAAPMDGQGESGAADAQMEMVLESEPTLYDKTQVMFILDTTGSMGDEMLYLQSDFGAIAEEAGDSNTTWAVSFYKDYSDTYVTKVGDFTGDTAAIKQELSGEMADGGGDEPEAVAEILDQTISGSEWQEDAAKVAFLIYDAPPHTGTEDVLDAAIAEASRKGIHLVPVVSSNGSRDTELFGRATAIMTNGSYVFLTDDSGIGSSHMEPIIGDYEVEKLHDVIVRIIQQYRDGQ